MQAVGPQHLQALAGVVYLPADKDKGSTQRMGRVRFTQRRQLLIQQPEGELDDDMSSEGSVESEGRQTKDKTLLN